MSALMMSAQPSIKTNSNILKGVDTMAGGSIIIPMDIKVVAITISNIKKGRKRMIPN